MLVHAFTVPLVITLAGLVASVQQPHAAEPTVPANTPAETAPAPAHPTTAPIAAVGEPAPAFQLTDIKGAPLALAELKGRIVVLSWMNANCANSRHAFLRGPIRLLARTADPTQVAFVTINPLPPTDPHGTVEATTSDADALRITHRVLMDPAATLTATYGVTHARTVAVIDAEGILRYVGAMDNAPNGIDPEEEAYTSYLHTVVNALLEQQTVELTRTSQNGCELATPATGG